MKTAALLVLAFLLAGCNDDAASPITFGRFGPLSGDAGRGSFRFGVATAATQIEDMNTHTDWYLWTGPEAAGGLGKSTFVGDATRGYSKVMDDLGLLGQLGVDSYRFSIEWARIEPDADGDGIAAEVGLSLSVADWEPSRDNKPSSDPEDIAARDRLVYLFHYLFVDAVTQGAFDTSLDGMPDEQHPEWAGTLDWLGLQYYFRSGVTGATRLIPVANLTPCFGGFNLGACLPAPDPTYCVPRMGYEGWTDGIHDILVAFHGRYPDLPLVVTEAGIATDAGKRRAENVARILESVARARDEGVDVRGYYYWSLTDNFEWTEGFGPHFGLYAVDYATYARTATEGATVLGAIARARTLTSAQRGTYGGTGPMTSEVGFATDPFCTKVPAP